MTLNKKRVVAIVDHQNILSQTKEIGIPLDDTYMAILEEAKSLGELIDVRIFVPTYQISPEQWQTINKIEVKFGVSVEACPVLREGGNFKDVVDSKILAWALSYYSCVDLVMLVSGDGDFIVAVNELKKRGKEVIGRTVSFKNASPALFEAMEIREMTTGNKRKPAISGNNQFFPVVAKATEGTEILNEEEKNELSLLAKAEEILPDIAREEMSLSILKIALAKELGVEEKKAQEILELLMAFDIVKCHPRMITAVTVESSSQFHSLEIALDL